MSIEDPLLSVALDCHLLWLSWITSRTTESQGGACSSTPQKDSKKTGYSELSSNETTDDNQDLFPNPKAQKNIECSNNEEKLLEEEIQQGHKQK